MNILNDSFPEMLTIDQTAQRSGLSAYAVRKLARSKQGQAFTVKVGAKYLLNWQKFTAFFNCEAAPTKEEPSNSFTGNQIQPVPVRL